MLQDVTGLLQDQLQHNDQLVDIIFCEHAHLLLQNGPSLDVFLRIVPLLRPDQQASVYQALCTCCALPAASGAH